ncbi:hypothetical protein M407DRAFT_9673 [Tulasnella calospora MUT 4182]|uniref:Uncharacterized protein n=1 Tax=Tulasnella calospora MUT 4182 TaxID=1051891 RepID=A0A0C3QDQ0_9AGAM|nr:hypothetical protein M407DRAFT_9673 [Tulasnella calospora MUT 4182]
MLTFQIYLEPKAATLYRSFRELRVSLVRRTPEEEVFPLSYLRCRLSKIALFTFPFRIYPLNAQVGDCKAFLPRTIATEETSSSSRPIIIDGTIYSIPLRLASKHLADLTKGDGSDSPSGESVNDPLHLEIISRHEMENFLDVMNASWIGGRLRLGEKGWVGALYTATKLGFHAYRESIANEMESTVRKLEALEMLELAVRLQGVEATVSICGVREKLARKPKLPCKGHQCWWGVRKDMLGFQCTSCSYVLAMIKAEKPLNLEF